MAESNNGMVRTFKVALLGESSAGKSAIVNYLVSNGNPLQLRKGEEIHDDYRRDPKISRHETWGMQMHQVSQQVTDQMSVTLSMWHSGHHFLTKFPFYTNFLLKDADLVVFVYSLTLDTELTDMVLSAKEH